MTSIRRALIYGVLVWLIPFVVAVAIFRLRESNRPLFESIMPVAVAAAVTGLGGRYLGDVTSAHVREGLRLGILWLLISVAIDAPLMLLSGPMRMSLGVYLADIGVVYLMMPVITAGIGAVLARRAGAPVA